MVDPNRDRTGAAADLPRYAVPPEGYLELSMDDLSKMVVLVASLNPDKWNSPAAKAVIYKCKSVVHTTETPTENIHVVNATLRVVR